MWPQIVLLPTKNLPILVVGDIRRQGKRNKYRNTEIQKYRYQEINISGHKYVVLTYRAKRGVTECYHVVLYISTNSGKSAGAVCKNFTRAVPKVQTCLRVGLSTEGTTVGKIPGIL